MSGGDTACTLPVCPLFSAYNWANFGALARYAGNVDVEFPDIYFRDKDMFAENNMKSRSFFRLNDFFSGVEMNAATNSTLLPYVYESIKMVASLIAYSSDTPTTEQSYVMHTFFISVVGVSWYNAAEKTKQKHFDSLLIPRDELKLCLYAMRNRQQNKNAWKMAAVFGWLLALIGNKSSCLPRILTMISAY